MLAIAVRVEQSVACKRRLLERLIALLPEWFGQSDSNLRYAESAEKLQGWIASVDGADVGLVLVKHHGPLSAELYWMGVDPAHHRGGVGSALVKAVCDKLTHDGIHFLFIMTLHPDDPYEPYQRTRRFYEKLGFTLALSDLEFAKLHDRLAYFVKYLPT
jgi:GNAT superfamily N-acetyltransferase